MTSRKKQVKPTVFLSHSSSNRRELLALKRVLDARAGGMIEFFLSSDDDSITHGTIWPEEVKAALDRMQLMLIFASSEALKSAWTYFEAGYGLHKLGTAKIYCLPGIDKGSLPSPFNILQNRNLHAAKDIALLIHQINEELNGRMEESVTRSDFESIFRRALLGHVDTGPRLDEVVKDIMVETVGPANSSDLFAETCKKLGFPCSTTKAEDSNHHAWCSTGVRISIEKIRLEPETPEIEITAEDRKGNGIDISISPGGKWSRPDYFDFNQVSKSVAETEAYNVALQSKNAVTREENDALKRQPRECTFTMVPIDLSFPTKIVDSWLTTVVVVKPPEVTIHLMPGVEVESRGEAIGAKIHGSHLMLQSDGSLLWRERAILKLDGTRFDGPRLEVTARPEVAGNLSNLQLEELVRTLCELQILSIPGRSKNGRRN